MAQNGTGASSQRPTDERQARGQTGTAAAEDAFDPAAEEAALQAAAAALLGKGGESPTMARALQHVVTRVTDEGLIVELFDLPDAPLFVGDSAVPMPVMTDLAAMLAGVFGLVTNGVAVDGHVRSYPIVLAVNPVWDLSTARAQAARGLLEGAGLPGARVQRVTGKADRVLAVRNPMAGRNNRLELILLRNDT